MLGPEAGGGIGQPAPRAIVAEGVQCFQPGREIATEGMFAAQQVTLFQQSGQISGQRALAKRCAAKEAFSKAVGTGFKRGVFMKDIGVVNARSGAPTLALAGGAAERLAAITPPGHEAVVHLTLTDDHPWAQAFIVIEARKLPDAP